jgi:hypothetical protein
MNNNTPTIAALEAKYVTQLSERKQVYVLVGECLLQIGGALQALGRGLLNLAR